MKAFKQITTILLTSALVGVAAFALASLTVCVPPLSTGAVTAAFAVFTHR